MINRQVQCVASTLLPHRPRFFNGYTLDVPLFYKLIPKNANLQPVSPFRQPVDSAHEPVHLARRQLDCNLQPQIRPNMGHPNRAVERPASNEETRASPPAKPASDLIWFVTVILRLGIGYRPQRDIYWDIVRISADMEKRGTLRQTTGRSITSVLNVP